MGRVKQALISMQEQQELFETNQTPEQSAARKALEARAALYKMQIEQLRKDAHALEDKVISLQSKIYWCEDVLKVTK